MRKTGLRTGRPGPGRKTDKLKPLNLSDAEKADLVAFLECFSGSEITAERPKSPLYGLLKFPMREQW